MSASNYFLVPLLIEYRIIENFMGAHTLTDTSVGQNLFYPGKDRCLYLMILITKSIDFAGGT